MKFPLVCLVVACFSLCSAQDLPVGLGHSAHVQRLFKFSGILSDTQRSPIPGAVALRFAMYNEPDGGEAYWQETQNVRPDAQGRYTILLGETALGGLPSNTFTSQGALWLGVQASGQPEQRRVLLVALPSAWKADPVGSSVPISKRAISIPISATERLLALILSIMFLAGGALAFVEVGKWWKGRMEQFGPPPLANLINYIPGPERRWYATLELRFPLAERLRSIRGRLQQHMPSIEEDRPKKAA